MPRLSVYFPEGSLEFEMRSNAGLAPASEETSGGGRRSHSSSLDEARRKLARLAGQRIETQRKHQQLLK